jgi:hypothetical protein
MSVRRESVDLRSGQASDGTLARQNKSRSDRQKAKRENRDEHRCNQ